MNKKTPEEGSKAVSSSVPAAAAHAPASSAAPVAAPADVPLNPELTFEGLGIPDAIFALLKKNNFTSPTPIQHQAIPSAVAGKDVIGIAQTGTGKTLAFGIPLLARLIENKAARAAIILPTRELALQVDDSIRKLGAFLGLRSVVLIGGAPMYRQKQDLRNDPQIIIATPGRLIDHMEQNTVSLANIRILILDEADRMLDMGFAPQIARILKAVPKERQTMLFSATMPAEIAKIAMTHMKLPLRIEVAPAGTSADKVEQEMIVVSKDARFPLLMKIINETKGSVLVFSRTKHGAHRVCQWLGQMNVQAGEIHSERSLGQRIRALDDFKRGISRILVATDIAARGIDVKNIALVVNYDLPDNNEDYVHRIGRTARAGTTGKAISFVLPDQMGDVRAIERLIRKTIPVTRHVSAANDNVGMPADMLTRSRGGSSFGGGRGYSQSRGGGSFRGGSSRSSGGRAPYHGGSSSSRGGYAGSRSQSGGFDAGARGAFDGRPSSASRPAFQSEQRPAGGRPPNPYYRVGLSNDSAPASRARHSSTTRAHSARHEGSHDKGNK